MTIKKSFSLIISLAMISMLVACGGSSSTTPPPKVVSIALESGLPTSLGTSTQLSISATVTNDSTAAGVDWTVTCASDDCGNFSAAHTASGTATTYTSPATIPTGATVTIAAASTKDSTKTASTTITIATTAAITVTFDVAPPSTLTTSATVGITADVANDTAAAGVDWTATCGSEDCGSFNPTHTASGSATTYTAPVAPPTLGTVTITAASTTDNTKTATAAITIANPITSYNQLLNGTYVFQISGSEPTSNPYQVAGVVTADGAGNISGGEEVFSDGNTVLSTAITSGVYTFGPDGRGTITLTTANGAIAVAGVQTLGAVVVSGSKVLLTEFDVSASARGTMELQTAVNPLGGGYAFVMGNTTFPIVFGGVFNIDNNPETGVISGAGSVGDIDEFGEIGTGGLTGTVSAPDSFGQVGITISSVFGDITMSGFIVDDSHIRLVQTDGNLQNSGVAVSQGEATGSFADNTAFSGNFVYGVTGECGEGNGSTAIAGTLSADGAGNLTGLADVNFGANDVISDAITGSYEVDDTGTGRVLASTTFGSLNPGPNFIFYLTQPNQPPLVLETDGFSLAAGSSSIQAAGPYTFSGQYGAAFTTMSGTELDGTGQIVADGVSAFTGTADINSTETGTPVTALGFTGAFTPDPSGRFATTVTLDGAPYSAAFYFIDSTQGFLIENDDLAVTFGEFDTQQVIAAGARPGRIASKTVQPKKK